MSPRPKAKSPAQEGPARAGAKGHTFRVPDFYTVALRSLGVDPAALLQKAGLPPTLWTEGRGMVTTEQFFSIWRSLGHLSDDPAIGFKVLDAFPLEQHPPASLAAFHARTFRDGLQRLSRYKLLCCGSEEMRIVPRKDETSVEFQWPLAEGDAPDLLLDVSFASMLLMGRHGTGRPVSPLRVELTRPARHRAVYEARYGALVSFAARRDAIVFRSADLDLPFKTYNAALLDMLVPQLEKERNRIKAGKTVASRVTWVLRQLLAGTRPEVGEVAKELGMSRRTLQRRITAEGTNFRDLLMEARRQLARHYLSQPEIGTNEAAFLLGFEDTNSFYRAFRGWENATPGKWRMSHN
jgi:AraC-like DNA-binding protein